MKKMILPFLALFFTLAACNNVDQAPVQGETRTVSTARGDVEIPAEPQRIADLSGVGDILALLGHAPVASSDADAYNLQQFPSYLEDLLGGAKIVGYSMSETVDLEGVIEAQPDLIIINPRQEAAMAQLSAIAPIIVIDPDVNDWRSDMRLVASLFSDTEQQLAEDYIAQYDEMAAAAGAQLKAQNGEGDTYLSFLASGGSFFLFSGAAYGDMLYNDFNLEMPDNLPGQDSIELPVVDIEQLVQINADHLIVIASDDDRQALEQNPLFTHLDAYQNGRVIWLAPSPYFNQAYSTYGRKLLLDEIPGWFA